jgi:hypothetical protein
MRTRIMPGRSLVIRKKVLVEKTLSLYRVGTDACTRERGCGGAENGVVPRSGPGTLEFHDLTRLYIIIPSGGPCQLIGDAVGHRNIMNGPACFGCRTR